MPGLLSAMEGFCVIGIVIATGYVAARMRIGGPTAQMVLNRFSFFVSSPCLMFAILSKEKIFEIFHSSIVVAFFSARAGGRGLPDSQPAVLPYESRGRHHRRAEFAVFEFQQHRPADSHVHSGQSRTRRADPGHAAGGVHADRPDRARRDHQRQGLREGDPETTVASAAAHRLAAGHRRVRDFREGRLFRDSELHLRPDRYDRRFRGADDSDGVRHVVARHEAVAGQVEYSGGVHGGRC